MRWEELINFTPPCAFSTISAPLPGLRQQCLILPFSLLFIWHASLFFPSFVLYISFCYCKYLLSPQFFFQMYILYSIYLQLLFCIHLLFLSCFSFFSLYIGLFLLQYITVLHINKCFFMWSALFTLQYSSSLCNCFFYISFVLLLFLTITWLYFYFYFFWTFYLFLSAYVPFFS